MTKIWTETEIKSLPTDDLVAIVRSTNPKGSLHLELSWAREELKRRRSHEAARCRAA